MACSHGVGPKRAGESGQRSRSVRPVIHHRKKRAPLFLFLFLSLFLSLSFSLFLFPSRHPLIADSNGDDRSMALWRSRGEEGARVALPPRENKTKCCRG